MKPSFTSDPVLLILLFATFAFAGLTLFIALHSTQDGQTFQLFGGLTTGFGGAVLGRVKPQVKEDHPPEPGTTKTVIEATETHVETPPEPPKEDGK